MRDQGLEPRLEQTTQIIWTTGGSLVPDEEYKKFLKFSDNNSSAGFLIRNLLQSIGAVTDLRGYGDEYHFLFEHSLPMTDPVLLCSIPEFDHDISLLLRSASPYLQEVTRKSTFRMFLKLLNLERNLKYETDRSRAKKLHSMIDLIAREVEIVFEDSMLLNTAATLLDAIDNGY